jgi:hypothetical protein
MFCEKPLCRRCAEDLYKDFTDDDEGLRCDGCECTACAKKAAEKKRIEEGRWTPAELEAEGQQKLFELEKP